MTLAGSRSFALTGQSSLPKAFAVAGGLLGGTLGWNMVPDVQFKDAFKEPPAYTAAMAAVEKSCMKKMADVQGMLDVYNGKSSTAHSCHVLGLTSTPEGSRYWEQQHNIKLKVLFPVVMAFIAGGTGALLGKAASRRTRHQPLQQPAAG